MNKKKKLFLILMSILGLIALSFALFVAPKEQQLARNLPSQLQKQNQKFSVKYTKINFISPFVQKAAVASQDRRFYYNWGIDLVGTTRAIFMTITTGKRQGASTIPEQLGKNAFFQDTDNLNTDIQTKLLAPFITFYYPKQYILEMYLNDIYFGKNAYGIYNASQIYFHTTPDKLSLSQSAYLIGLINAPSYLSAHKNEAVFQAQLVLEEMQKDKYITPAQEQEAKKNL